MDKIDPIIQGWGAGACQSRGFLGSLEPEPESLQKKTGAGVRAAKNIPAPIR